MAIDPASLINPRARWQPGDWTPARCELWRQVPDDGKQWLEKWVMAEFHDGARKAEGQLPVWAKKWAAKGAEGKDEP